MRLMMKLHSRASGTRVSECEVKLKERRLVARVRYTRLGRKTKACNFLNFSRPRRLGRGWGAGVFKFISVPSDYSNYVLRTTYYVHMYQNQIVNTVYTTSLEKTQEPQKNLEDQITDSNFNSTLKITKFKRIRNQN